MADQYNLIAIKNNWEQIENTPSLALLPTKIACIGQSIEGSDSDQKVTRHLPDQYLLEYNTFFRLLSYYLPE